LQDVGLTEFYDRCHSGEGKKKSDAADLKWITQKICAKPFFCVIILYPQEIT